MTECRYVGCTRDTRNRSGAAGRYCSTEHQLKHEHIKADARDAMRAEEGGR